MDGFVRAVTAEQKSIRRQEIKDSAERLMTRVPLFDLSFTDIAKEAGCTRSNLYKYYSNVTEILADIWADKITVLNRGIIERLDSLTSADPASYAEVIYTMYFDRNDILKYLTLQPVLAEDPAARAVMKSLRPRYSRWTAEHRERIMSLFGLGMDGADMILVEEYRLALGLYNVEKTEISMMPELAGRYANYIHSRFVKALVKIVERVIRTESERVPDEGETIKSLNQEHFPDRKSYR